MTNNANDYKHQNGCQFHWQGDDLLEGISAYVDAELTVDEMEGLRQHILVCHSCAQTEQRFRNVDLELHRDMGRPLVSRSLKFTDEPVRKNPGRQLKSPQFAPSRSWLAGSSVAAAGIVALAAIAAGTLSLSNDPVSPGVDGFEESFSQAFMTNVVVPLGEMALNNDVCKSQQKQIARSLDLELRLLRLDTRNISTNDDELRKINEEIDSLMNQVKQLGYANGTTANDVPSL